VSASVKNSAHTGSGNFQGRIFTGHIVPIHPAAADTFSSTISSMIWAGLLWVAAGLGQKIVHGKFGQPQLAQFPLNEPIASGRLKLGDTTGQFFVQGIVFFMSQVTQRAG
jgi:hypothetical protein